MRKLWGRPNSSNVMKVVWLLEELGLPYERIDAGGAFGRTKDADYLAMNPNSLVPTLEEDGFVLWESHAILRYLASQHADGTSLWPADKRARANIDRWMDWQHTALTAAQTVVFQGLVRTPAEQRDTGAIETALVTAARAWTLLDRHLEHHEFVAGPNFTLADIPCGVHVHRWFSFMVTRPELPALRGWYDRLLQRPAYREHCAQPMS